VDFGNSGGARVYVGRDRRASAVKLDRSTSAGRPNARSTMRAVRRGTAEQRGAFLPTLRRSATVRARCRAGRRIPRFRLEVSSGSNPVRNLGDRSPHSAQRRPLGIADSIGSRVLRVSKRANSWPITTGR
jgi:hypothetical protein